MKKLITSVLAASFIIAGTINAHAVPQRPAGVHPQATYLEYKGMDCWRYWKVLKCLPR